MPSQSPITIYPPCLLSLDWGGVLHHRRTWSAFLLFEYYPQSRVLLTVVEQVPRVSSSRAFNLSTKWSSKTCSWRAHQISYANSSMSNAATWQEEQIEALKETAFTVRHVWTPTAFDVSVALEKLSAKYTDNMERSFNRYTYWQRGKQVKSFTSLEMLKLNVTSNLLQLTCDARTHLWHRLILLGSWQVVLRSQKSYNQIFWVFITLENSNLANTPKQCLRATFVGSICMIQQVNKWKNETSVSQVKCKLQKWDVSVTSEK